MHKERHQNWELKY